MAGVYVVHAPDGCTQHNAEELTVQDLIDVALIFALIGIAVLFVLGCDKIVGPDEQELVDESDAALEAELLGGRVSR